MVKTWADNKKRTRHERSDETKRALRKAVTYAGSSQLTPLHQDSLIMACNCPPEVCERGGCSCEGRSYSMLLEKWEDEDARGIANQSDMFNQVSEGSVFLLK